MPDDPNRPRLPVELQRDPEPGSVAPVGASPPSTPAVDGAPANADAQDKARHEARAAIHTQFQRDQQPTHADALHPLTPREREHVEALRQYEERQAREAEKEALFSQARQNEPSWVHGGDWLRQDNQQLAQDRSIIRNDAAHEAPVAQDEAALAAQATAQARYPSYAGGIAAALEAERVAELEAAAAKLQAEGGRQTVAAGRSTGEGAPRSDAAADRDQTMQAATSEPETGYRSYSSGIAAALEAERQADARSPAADRASGRDWQMAAAMDPEMTDMRAARMAAQQRTAGTEHNSESLEANASRARNSTERGRGRE